VSSFFAPPARAVWTLVAVAAGVALLPAVANAATVGRDATTLTYSAAQNEANRLTITPAGTSYAISDPGAGTLLDGDGAGGCAVSGKTATCPASGLNRIVVSAADHPDTVAVGGAVRAEIDGGGGADNLTGTRVADVIKGGDGADSLAGDRGQDTLDGGAGGDALAGGDGTDTATYENRGNGVTVDIDGVADDGNVSDENGPGGPRDNVGLDVENLTGGNGGDDLTGSSGENELRGGAGPDTLRGLGLGDLLLGGSGADTGIGGPGDDRAFLGSDNDTFQWDPGDGSDVVEGQANLDTLRFNGANIAEHVDLSANGSRLRLTRDVASIVMDVNGVETVDQRALGGADTITVNDLSATDVTKTIHDLGGADGAADR
jgi:Ca2+-binding RTX toxin-like protein